MQNNYTTKGKHLTHIERKMIERWKNKENYSNREIARRLGKAPQTINNEIKRGLVDLTYSGGKIEYSADIAQADYLHFRSAVGRTDTWTIEKMSIIKSEILNKKSPEVISQQSGMPSFSTIYNWIKKGWILGLSTKNLLYPRKPQSPKINRHKPPRKTNALSIDDRPLEINERLEVGHFEIDLLILNHRKGQQLLTLTDRKTRYEIIRLIPDKTAHSVNQEMAKLSQVFNFKSITADNGAEFLRLHSVLDCPIYYAHPYASYERGSNENANRLIRRFLPKGTTATTSQEVAAIESWINRYPRKLFNFKCPLQLPEVANLLL